MSEVYSSEHPINLRTIERLQNIEIRDDLRLRPLSKEDSERILDILATDHTIRDKVTIAAQLHTIDDVEDEIEQLAQNPDRIRYAILENDEFVGLMSLSRNMGFFGHKNDKEYYFGYFLDPSARGKEITVDTLRALMEVVAKSVPVEQYIAYCSDDNVESLRVLNKVGFEATNKILNEPNMGWPERKYVRRPAFTIHQL